MNNEPEYDSSKELNPYYATVIGFVDRDGQLVDVPNELQHDLLINVGSMDDVKLGERVLVFALGAELKDPGSNESLGHFEIVRGEGKVTSIQTRMAVVTSTRTSSHERAKPGNALAVAAGLPREVEYYQLPVPFKKPQIGDFVRFI